MGPPGVLGVLALLLVLQLAACQNPFIPVTDTCSIQRCEEPTKFKYTVGESYRYKYSASTASTVLGVTRKSTNLTLECDVIVHVITPCEHAITIENVQLNTVAEDQGSTVDRNIESDSFSSPLESYHLRYGFHDGVVDAICPENGDPTWSVNVKRGIVSTLQNSMDRIDLDYSDVERDVTGDCPVSYAVEGTDGAALVISKKRDLNACVGRFAHTSHIQGVGYSIKSPVQNIPVVASTSTCRQKVLTNRLTSVICEERHLLKPFSNDESGAVTITSQNLTLVPEDTANAGVSEYVIKNRDTLLYNHLPAKSASHTREKSLADAKALVEELCENDSEVRVESTTKFSQLIDDLRGMTHAEIRALHQHSPSICRHGQQLIEDALPVVSTAGSLNLMTDLIVDGKVTDRVANTWLLALNFIPSVDQEMLRIASGLLEVRNPAVATRARLAAGAVLYQYCRQHEKCDRDSVALETMEQLVRPLGADCRANSEEEERKVLLTLRAAGNAGLSPPSVVDTLNECFMSRDNPARIKVAAIEAFRRFSCTVRRDFMRAVFRDMAEDSEVRIAAYLGLMRCPSHQEVGLVRAALEREQVNQVGSFVWTHLMNLQETASPYQLEVQGLLADLHLQNKFSIDTRKYSRNFEISGFNSEYHVGASLDSNLVYSSKSYIPRSLNSNLTLQMFGESVNLLEVGARVEGMERLVESVFAPGGGLHNAAPEPLFRSRRDATQREKLEKIKADFDAAGRMGDPQAFFHMKVFGHEVDGVDLRSSDANRVTGWLTENGPGEWIKWLGSTESLDISRSVKFLEGTYIVPTGVGLPMNLTVSAVAAVNVQMSGNAQLERLFSSQELDLAFRLRPSGAVTCDMTMMVDGMAVQLGMGMKATVHSSTLVDASLRMEGFRLVNAQVNMPKERMDVYNFESSMEFIHQDQQTTLTSEITMEGDKHQQVSFVSCSGNERVLGWKLCAQLHYVNASDNEMAPHFPLTGPTKIALSVEKTDKTMQGYKLEWGITDNNFEHNLIVTLDTPESTIDRRVQLKLKRSKKHGRIGFIFTYPGEKLSGNGETAWEMNRKKLALQVSRRGVQVLDLTAQLVTDQTATGVMYRHTFILNLVQNPYANLQGFVKISQDESAMQREIDLGLTLPSITLGLVSNATESPELYKSKIAIKHTLRGGPQRELSLLLEARDGEDGDGGRVGHWMMATDVDLTEHIRFAWAGRWDSKKLYHPCGIRKMQYCENSRASTMNKIQTALRPEQFDTSPTFSVGYRFDYMSTEESSKVRGSVHLKYPSARLDLMLLGEHANIYRGLVNKITLRYAPGRELHSRLNLTGLPVGRTDKLEGYWELEVPGYPYSIQLAGDIRRDLEAATPSQYKYRMEGRWLSGGSALATGIYRLQLNEQAMSVDHRLELDLAVEGRSLLNGSVELGISPTVVAVGTQVTYSGSDYGVEARYWLAPVESDIQRSVRLGLTYPGSAYSVTGTLRLGEVFRTTLELSLPALSRHQRQRDVQLIVGGSHTDSLLAWVVDLKWDANWDPTQRLMMDFRAEEPSDGTRNVTVRMVYPVNTIQLTMDRTMTGGWTRLQYHNHVLLAFGELEPVEMTVSASTALDVPTKRVSVDATLTSPFPHWARNSLKLSHARSASSLQSRLEVLAGGERFIGSLDGQRRGPGSVTLAATVTSTMERLRRVEARLDHQRHAQGITSSLVLETPENRISGDLALRDLSGGGEMRYRAELNVTTPFQGMHDATYMLDARRSAESFILTGESRVENIGHNLVFKGEESDRIEGSLILDQIHPQLNLFTAEMLLDPSEAGRAFKTSLKWPDNRAELEGNMHFRAWNDFGAGLQFISPLEAIRDVGLMVKTKQTGPYAFQSEARVAWLGENPLGLMVDFDLEPPGLDPSKVGLTLKSELRLPLRFGSRIALGLKGVVDRTTRTLSAGIDGALDQYKVALTADGSLGSAALDKRYGTISVTLPAGPVRQLTVAASVLPSADRKYELFFSPVWKMEDGSMQQIRVTSVIDISQMAVTGSVHANLRVLTPWTEMLFLDMQHSRTPQGEIDTRLVGSMGRHNAEVKLKIVVVMRGPEQGVKAFLSSTSNIPAFPVVEASAVYTFNPNQLTVTLLTPYEYRVRLAADWKSADRKSAAFELLTPLDGLDRVAANLELVRNDGAMDLAGTLTLPGYQRPVAVSGTYRPLDLRLTFSTPFEGVTSGSVRLSAAVGGRGPSDVVLRVAWERYKVELTGTATVGRGGVPQQVTGTLIVNLPVGPRVNGRFQLAARPGEQLVYDLSVTSSVDEANYQLKGEIFTGPSQFGVVVKTSSNGGAAQVSAEALLILSEAVAKVRMSLDTPHEALRNVSLTAEYRNSPTEGYKLSYKLRHPRIQVEASTRVSVHLWPVFYIGVNGKVAMGRMVLERSARVFHEPGRGGKTELGVAWDVSADRNRLAGWGRYAVLADYALSGAGFDGQLLAGRDADRDRTAPTDLRLGADVDWQRSAAMGRAVLTAHIRDALYTLDTDYSGADAHTGSVRFVRRMRGSELEVTARGHLTKDSVTDRYMASLNLTMPVDGYKAVNTVWQVKHMPKTLEFESTIEIDPKSSFYQHTKHHLELNYDGQQQVDYNAKGDFSYVHHDLDDDLDVTKVNGKVNFINNEGQMGASAEGELNDGRYALELMKTQSQELGNTGKLNITSTFESLQEFVANYKVTRDRANQNALTSTFGAVYNGNQLVDGTYQFMSDGLTQRHTLNLENPLHPFDADVTFMGTVDQRRAEFTINSHRDNRTVSGWAQRIFNATGYSLEAKLTLPERQLGLKYSGDNQGDSYTRAARLSLSSEAFVGYHYSVSDEMEMHLEEGSVVRLQLDFPARSLAGTMELARTPTRRNDAHSSGRAKLKFQWDAERQPERQVAATFNVADLSTADNRHYNFSVNLDLVGKPVTLDTSVQTSSGTPLQLDAAFRYSTDPDSHLTMSYSVVDQSRGSKLVLKSTLFVSHPISRLSVTGKGLLEVARGTLKVSGAYTYLDIEDRRLESKVLLELDRKLGEFKAEVTLPSMIYELKSTVGLKEYRINGAAIPTELGSPQTLLATMDRERPLVRLEILYDPEQAKRLYVTGGMVNNRTVRLEAYRQAGQYRVDDMVFFLRLNHSHLLTSQARWRTELGYELAEWARSTVLLSRDALLDACASEWEVKAGAMESSLEDMLGQEIDLLVEEFTSESSGTVRGDFEDIRYAISESYENNAFYMNTIISYVYGDEDSVVSFVLNKLGTWTEELREDLGVINEAVYVRLNEIIEYLRRLVSSSGSGERSMTDTLREVLAEMAEAYNQWAKAVYARTSLRLRQVYTTVTGYIRHRMMQLGQQYKPQLLLLYHHFEENVVAVVRDTVNWFYGEFTESELYAAIVSLEGVIDEIYRDLSDRDTVTNIFDYTKKFARWLYTKFGLEDVLGEPGLWLKDMWDNPPPALVRVKQFIMVAYVKVSPILEDISDVMQNLFSKIYRDGDKFWTQTAIQGAQRYFEGKSIMEMNPDRGYISFIQILPMPWYGLNQSPVWEELPELQQLRYLQSFTEDSSAESGGVYDFIYDYWPGSNPTEWMPPFAGHAVLSGSSTIVTFDGRLYTFRSDCTYLLAADLLHGRFSVEATFRRRGRASKTLSVTAGAHTIELGGSDGYKITADGRPADAPLELGDLRAVRSGDLITVSLPGWLELKCNQRSDVCALEISRWMFGRTGGLFGTLDNEQFTDLQTPDHHSANGPLFAAGWALQHCRRPADITEPGKQEADTDGVRAVAKRTDGFCRGLLESPSSEYRVCHRLVDPRPFLAACEAQQDEQRCVAVRAYVEACQQLGWPLKMPNKCVQCSIAGQSVFEGKTVKVRMEKPATEVVFIVEAKQCNANATHERSLNYMARSLNMNLRREGFATTRFAVIAFGGSGVLNEPRVMTVDGHIFNSAKKVPEAFDQIKPGSGGRDVFGALRRAAMLPFTPGVSRTFILLPCSPCEATEMSIDYTTLANAFAEQQVTLHVVMDGDIKVSKQQNRLVGIDKSKAYTMKDAKRLRGDSALLKHVKRPKSELRLCEPLAIEQTNGAIFSSSKLKPQPRKAKLKRFLTVFGRRVAQTARPEGCQSCECATDVEGTVRPVCMSCRSDLLLPLDPDDDIFIEE
ncbi:uncharacterized protein LOC122382611 isoform X2 [Amphibalanus amphitrite]|uniref:uncharacterized protein LOC122382611 isoform X2 n=1 Tax=Amphibalanus amphitrite TaxID=1232801 RepID=UPI001C90A14E|nr:uncharacterized protein LOC122382611 isoform X2 [Amphibalanus amphitrite]